MDINWDEAPTDATHYLPETKETFECWIKPGYSMQVRHQKKWIADDTSDVEYLFIPRPEKWNGEGLPPVGTVCEHEPDGFSDKWVTVEVLAHREFKGHDTGLLVVFATEDDVSFSSPECFRPIKTKEQLAAEKREKAIREMVETCYYPGSTNTYADCEALYDAGYRKQENNDAKA